MHPHRAAIVALCTLSLIWGYSWVFLKLGLLDAGPFTYAGLRTLLGALCLLAVLPLAGRSLRLERTRELILLGLMNTTGAVGCSQWALVDAAANRTSILMFTMPFWTLLLARPLLDERVRGAQWLAVGLAAAGLVSVLRPWTLAGPPKSGLIVLTGALLWAASAVMIKRILTRAPMDLLVLTTWQMTFGSLGLFAIAFTIGEPQVIWTQRFVTALALTGVISTAFGWMLWVYLLNKLPAGMASMMTLMVPVVAVSSTSYHLGERLAPGDVLGISLIIGGLVLLSWQAIVQHRTVTGVAAPE